MSWWRPSGVQRVAERNEVARDQARALVNQLIERMLPVRARLAPVDGTRLVVHRLALDRHVLSVALHRQLLEICGEPFQVVLVRQHRDRRGAEEVRVPDRQQTHDHRQVSLERCRPEVLVHGVEAVEHSPEVLRADRDHGGQADRRVHRVAAAHPVPEAEHVGRIDAERRDLFGVGRDGDEVLRHGGAKAAEPRQQPVTRALRVGHRLERREGLRRDDEERLGGIEVARRLDQIDAIHVRDEAERQSRGRCSAATLRTPSPGRGRTPDPDVDHVADAPAGVAGPAAAPYPVGERGHPVEHVMYVGTTFLPSTVTIAPRGARKAVCSTARFSVTLIRSPPNIASMRSRRPHASASRTSRASVSL